LTFKDRCASVACRRRDRCIGPCSPGTRGSDFSPNDAAAECHLAAICGGEGFFVGKAVGDRHDPRAFAFRKGSRLQRPVLGIPTALERLRDGLLSPPDLDPVLVRASLSSIVATENTPRQADAGGECPKLSQKIP
jgi:hypothetical protein